MPEKLFDTVKDDAEKDRVLEWHRGDLKLLCLQEQQEQHTDDLKSRLEDKSSICTVGHDLNTNRNTTGLPGSLRDETQE